MQLRAFSIRQPWASLLMSGVKRFEVRPWRPKDDILLVHASSGKAVGMPGYRSEAWFRRALRLARIEDEAAWVQSSIVGAVTIAKVWERGQPPRLSQFDEQLCGNIEDQYVWEVGRRWVFKRPVECPGKLNLWHPPRETWRRIHAQLSKLRVPLTA